jgi:hypothetical protein
MKFHDRSFCELAPLHALDMLDQQEQEWLEAEVIKLPELADELADYQNAAMAIAYSAPSVSIADNLKARLFTRIGLESPQAVPTDPDTTAPPGETFQAMRTQDLRWRLLFPGVEVAIVHINRSTREQTGFLRAAPGTHYPNHRHAAIEEILMMSGDLIIQDQVYGAGDYIRSYPGSSHSPYTKDGCMFFFRTSMDDEYLQ